jgi:hypothetical protein
MLVIITKAMQEHYGHIFAVCIHFKRPNFVIISYALADIDVKSSEGLLDFCNKAPQA